MSRAQVLALGLSPNGISKRLLSVRLLAVHRGVYAVGHAELRREGRFLAAVLACGRDAVLSHRSAAALWEIRANPPQSVDVSVPSTSGRTRRRGIRVHRSRRLDPAEVTVNRRIPVTTVPRTLLDIADVLPRQALKRAIDEAEYRQLLDLTALDAAVQTNPGRRGAQLLQAARAAPELTRSELEQRFLELVASYDLPRPKVAARVENLEVDFLWPRHGLIVETDGLAAHGTRAALESDRARDRRLTLAGYRVIRLTARALRHEPDAIVTDLRALLRQTEPG